MRRSTKVLAYAVLLCLLASCSAPALSVNPITSPEDATNDKRLVGAWQSLDEGDDTAVFLIIGPPEKNISRVLYTGVSEEEFGVYNLAMFPSGLQSGSYLNVFYPKELRDFDLEEKEFIFREEKISKDFFGDNYMFLKYEFLRPNVLVLRYINDSLINKAIEKKQLKGETRGEKTLITDSSENIAAFMDSMLSSDLSSQGIFIRISPKVDETLIKELEALLKKQEKETAPKEGEEEKTDTGGAEDKDKEQD